MSETNRVTPLDADGVFERQDSYWEVRCSRCSVSGPIALSTTQDDALAMQMVHRMGHESERERGGKS